METWEDFEDEVAATSRPKYAQCGIGVLLKTLNDKAKVALQSALDNEALSHRAIQRALDKRVGPTAPGAFTIGRHRRGDCSCRREGR